MKHIAYIGCYTDEAREGIQIVECDCARGTIRKVGAVRGIENSTCLAINKRKTLLYAGQGMPEYGPRAVNGAVAAYAIKGGVLELINHRRIHVTPPCYVSLSPTEKSLVFAEYTNATAGVFELNPDGGIAFPPPVTVRHRGSGPDKSRQRKAHAHCAIVSPDSLNLCVADLGTDQVKVYDFTGRAEGLREKDRLTIRAKGGAGPRHLVFHPNHKTAYLLHELNNTISSFIYSGDRFEHVQTLGMLPTGFTGDSKASAIKFSPDGKRLFGSNRGHDSIAVYEIAPETARMSLLTISRLAGETPRDFEFMPGGKFVLVGHEGSNEIMVYSYDAVSGTLTPTSAVLPMYRPVYILFGAELN